MKKKVHKLVVPVSDPFKLLGISSHENDYRISWVLNRRLGMKFRKTDNHRGRPLITGEYPEFSVFSSYDEDKIIKMNLISNRCPDCFLVSDLKNIDYFLQVFGEISQEQLDSFSSKIREDELISTVFEIEPDRIRKTWHLPPE